MSLPSSTGDRNNNPLVWIVILHWREIDVTRACLRSVLSMTFENYKTLVVDNGSDHKDGDLLAQEFPAIEILRLEENHGFAGGCNKGMEAALRNGADFIWLLNNDTTVAAQSLFVLIEQAKIHPRAAVLGATVVDSIDRDHKQVLAGIGVIDFVKAKTSVVKGALVSDSVPCQWLHGSNLLLRSEALNSVGQFDERYFLYFEDTELCHRMRLAGWECVFVPEAEIEHIGSASTEGKRKYWRSYYYIRNRFLFFATYLPGAKRVPAMFFMTMHIFRHALVLPFRGENGRCQLRAELLGFKDYLTKNFGKAKCLDWCEP